MSRLHLLPAGAPELVRSTQKDRFYIDRVYGVLSEITRSLVPVRYWARWQREYHLVSELVYHGLTTLLDYQTLGEEYTNILQVSSTQGQPLYIAAGFTRRLVAVLLQSLGPYIVERVLNIVYCRLSDRSVRYLDLTEQQLGLLENLVEWVEETITLFNKLHLALFYLRGVFYHVGKRLTGINYVMVRYISTSTLPQLSSSKSTYQLLSWIIFVQVVFKIIRWTWNYCLRQYKAPIGELLRDVTSDPTASVCVSVKCPLCLEGCLAATSTVCGHVFCWECVCAWVCESVECPVCRCTVDPQQLVCLQHFEQS